MRCVHDVYIYERICNDAAVQTFYEIYESPPKKTVQTTSHDSHQPL